MCEVPNTHTRARARERMRSTLKPEERSQLSSDIGSSGGACLFDLPLNKSKVMVVCFKSFRWQSDRVS